MYWPFQKKSSKKVSPSCTAWLWMYFWSSRDFSFLTYFWSWFTGFKILSIVPEIKWIGQLSCGTELMLFLSGWNDLKYCFPEYPYIVAQGKIKEPILFLLALENSTQHSWCKFWHKSLFSVVWKRKKERLVICSYVEGMSGNALLGSLLFRRKTFFIKYLPHFVCLDGWKTWLN